MARQLKKLGFMTRWFKIKPRVKLNMERVDYWMSVGAQPSEKVNALIRKVKLNKFGRALAPPPLIAPKVKEVAPAEEVSAEPAE